MRWPIRWLVPLVLALGSLGTLAADANPPTIMTERGEVVYSNDLNAPLEKTWKIAKGDWKITDGVLSGTELESDHHGAVARYGLEFRDIVIQYEVKLGAAKVTTLSINDAKSHICRISLSATGFTAQKDDHDHDGPNKGVVFGKKTLKLGSDWHTVVLELQGTEMLAHVDDAVIYGSSPEIDVPKANFGLTVGGAGAQFRNLRVWPALPNPKWAQTRAALTKP